jgi:hypothetical protein
MDDAEALLFTIPVYLQPITVALNTVVVMMVQLIKLTLMKSQFV